MTYMIRNDCKLYYEVHGKGTPLLLLHGNGEDHTYFHYQITYFSQFYQVIVMDTRGHGHSDIGKKQLSFALFAEDVKALLTHLHIMQTHLLGFSDGGNIAMSFSLKYPQYIKTLILNGANYQPDGVKRHVQIPLIIYYRFCSLLTRWNSACKDKQRIIDLMIHQPHIALAQLQTINVKTLVLVGEHDMIKESHSKMIAATIPHAVFKKIKGDHFIANKESQAFNRVVSEFLTTSLSNKKDA